MLHGFITKFFSDHPVSNYQQLSNYLNERKVNLNEDAN